MEATTPAGRPIVSREKTAPFLIRTFIKLGSFHRLSLFEDNALPTADEHALYTWKDATLREVLTSLRDSAPNTVEYRHPLARYSFRAIYADSASRGRFSQKELGMVYSRDILGEPGTLTTTAPRLLEDADANADDPQPTDREKEERTLDELRFVPGDYLCIAVLLPKNLTVPVGTAGDVALKSSLPGSATAAAAPNGWRGAGPGGPSSGRGGDAGWSGTLAPAGPPGPGRGGGHWRGDSNPAPPGGGGMRGGGRGGRGDFAGRDREFDGSRGGDRRVPPPRRDSPPHRGGGRDRRSRSRSRSPQRFRRRFD